MRKIRSTHGGSRKGSGRKKKEPTKVMRIPVSKVDSVKELCRPEQSNNTQTENI